MKPTKVASRRARARPTPSAFDRLLRVRIVSWEWNDRGQTHLGKPADVRQIGVLAQQVEKLFPDLIGRDDAGIRRVDYSGLAALAVMGVQTLHKQQQMLEKRLAKLERKR
jgi:hypothetical protein